MADIVNIYWVRYLTSTTDENIESNENELKATREIGNDVVEAMRRLRNNSSETHRIVERPIIDACA